MKIKVEIDDALDEDEIVIHTKKYNSEIKEFIDSFKSKPKIQFFKQDTEYYLDLDTILFFGHSMYYWCHFNFFESI